MECYLSVPTTFFEFYLQACKCAIYNCFIFKIMIRKFRGERWKEADFPNAMKKRYAISNRGRLASFTENLWNDGNLLKGTMQQGYRIMRYKVHTKKTTRNEFVFFHTLVAKYFCKQPSPLHNKIIFKDYNRKHITADNLQWVTPETHHRHSVQSQKFLKSLKNRSLVLVGSVLTADDVKKIKLALQQGKTLASQALKFGVSDMQIHRIKTGENWGHVRV
jgi:hypothetical protein